MDDLPLFYEQAIRRNWSAGANGVQSERAQAAGPRMCRRGRPVRAGAGGVLALCWRCAWRLEFESRSSLEAIVCARLRAAVIFRRTLESGKHKGTEYVAGSIVAKNVIRPLSTALPL